MRPVRLCGALLRDASKTAVAPLSSSAIKTNASSLTRSILCVGSVVQVLAIAPTLLADLSDDEAGDVDVM